ncbi:MAG: type II toxin-antitoxin system VapC family toxin [Acidimicrobiia bacterium]
MTRIAVDTSVAVAYLLRSHTHHQLVRGHLSDHEVCLTGHSLAETYSVLTRLPGDARVTPDDARRLIEMNFPIVVPVPARWARRLHFMLSEQGIGGGATYDAVVALSARHGGLALATRDLRAASTYAALSVQVELIAG